MAQTDVFYMGVLLNQPYLGVTVSFSRTGVFCSGTACSRRASGQELRGGRAHDHVPRRKDRETALPVQEPAVLESFFLGICGISVLHKFNF